MYVCLALVHLRTASSSQFGLRESEWKPCMLCRSCSQLFGCFLRMNILLLPDASVNREAAAVYRVKMKSHTSLALQSKCISTCKHILHWSGILTQILADSKTTSALIDSVKVMWYWFRLSSLPQKSFCFHRLPVFPTGNEQQTSCSRGLNYRESFFSGLCSKNCASKFVSYLFWPWGAKVTAALLHI